MLDAFSLLDIKAYKAPMVSNLFDERSQHEDDPSLNDVRYRSLVESLMCISSRTKPDIASAIYILAQY